MASILRSSKFVRYFAGFTRNLIFNTPREVEGNLIQQSQCICGTFTNGFATAAKSDQSLELTLKKLDQDVRRSGRVSRRDIEEVLEEIRQQKSATSSQSLMVIRCCGNLVPEELPEVRTAMVLEIWKTLNKLNVPMDISHYNALLRVYLENEHPFSPTEFLSDLESKGIEPNRVTYQRLISRYCQQGDIEGATRILEFMREKQLPVNENVFNALIMGHSYAGDMESAAGILSVMQQASLEPSADTYTTLLCGYALKGDIENIQHHLEICEKKEIYLLDKDFLDIIYTLTINGHEDKIDLIIKKLKKSTGFNQDVVNIILRLINKGYTDVAFKLLKTMPRGVRSNGEVIDTGNFFIKHLVKSKTSVEKIINFCKEMEENELNSKALLVAIEAGLVNGLIDLTLKLLSEAKKNNLPIKQHYFWPLICSSQSKGNEGLLDVLSKMQNDFDMTPSSETIREYVIPNLNVKDDYEKVITLLRSAGITHATAVSCTTYHLLNKHNLKAAAEIACSGKTYFQPGLFRKPLLQALSTSHDYDSYIKLVRQIYESIPRIEIVKRKSNEEISQENEDIEDESNSSNNQKEVLGQILHDAASYFRKNRVEVLTKILDGLIKEGLTISNNQAEKIQEIFGSELNSEISIMLGKLSSGDLEPKNIDKDQQKTTTTFSQMSVEQLERLIKNFEARGENTKNIKRYLLAATLKSKDLSKTEDVINRLNEEGYVLASGVHAQLIDLYTHHEKLTEALDILSKTKTKEPDFILDNMKTIRLATLLVKNEKYEDALKLLDDNTKSSNDDEQNQEKSFNYQSTCWRLLNQLAESGKVDVLDQFFEKLQTNNYINVNNVMLGPLIKVHLVNNDLKKAIDKFEEICTKYQSTPWKNELACKLIQAEDAQNLQKLTDLSTNIHGEVNSLYDLVFSFVECGRIRQARKILETPGLRNRPQRINTACERYQQEGMVQSLEGLMEATKDLNHIDRSKIFYNLLVTYCKENNPEKALGLWTKLQEEDIPPTDDFLNKLGEFLKSKEIEVPFVIPKQNLSSTSESKKIKSENPKPQEKSIKNQSGSIPPVSEKIYEFRKALKSGDIDKALNLKTKMSESDNLSVTDNSLLLEGLVKAERLNEATKHLIDMLNSNIQPLSRIFRFYLNKIATSGDVTTLENIGKYLNSDTKKLLSYDNRLCHANLVAGKSEIYLNNLVKDLENAKTNEEISMVAEKFPRGGAVGILEKDPSIINKFEELAEKYASKGILGPMNVLWVHYFINDNVKEYEKIWDKYLSSAPRLMFQRIVHIAREKQDEHLIRKLIELLKNTKISEGALGNAYSCLLDVYSLQEKFDEASKLLEDIVKDVCLENINRTALLRLKTGLEKQGKTFNMQIPQKTIKNQDDTSTSSSSSSSSDEERSNKSKMQ